MPSGAYSRGRLSSVSTPTGDTSTATYSAYDALGRVLTSSQSTAGTTYNFSYSYNLTDALTSETYPSGNHSRWQTNSIRRRCSTCP
jgi:YD repeat-containing protein